MPRQQRGSRARNLDTYSASQFSGRGYRREYQAHLDSQEVDADPEQVPDLCRNGRFWVVTSIALFSLIMGILLASLVHPPRCPDSCHRASCVINVQLQNGNIREKTLDCTCSQEDSGLVYCANKTETTADKTLSAISTLFFVLFFVILILSCAFVRCLGRSEDRRVGIEEDIQIVHPAQAQLSVHNDANVYSVQDYIESGETSDLSAPISPNYAQNDVMNTIPVATISRKPDVPTAVAVLL